MTTREPVLDRRDYDHKLVIAYGGLRAIKGNAKPYFTLTGETRLKARKDRWIDYNCGAIHNQLLKTFPRFADLVALHLSDIDGVPMHALENGLYHLSATKWQEANYTHVANHFRISEDEALSLPVEREALAQWVEDQKPRWKAEAEACIVKHGLVVFGD